MWLQDAVHLADWGSVPSWIGSLITSGSLLVATATYRRSVRDQKAEQALKIVAWSIESADAVDTRRVFLSNRSSHAIYNVRLIPFDAEEVTFNDFEPGQDSWVLPMPAEDRLERSSELSTNLSAVPFVPIQVALNRQQRRQEPYPYLEFVDASGRAWLRDGRGELRRRSLHGNPRSTLSLSIAGFPVLDLWPKRNNSARNSL